MDLRKILEDAESGHRLTREEAEFLLKVRGVGCLFSLYCSQ